MMNYLFRLEYSLIRKNISQSFRLLTHRKGNRKNIREGENGRRTPHMQYIHDESLWRVHDQNTFKGIFYLFIILIYFNTQEIEHAISFRLRACQPKH